jgi:hypothetical protein
MKPRNHSPGPAAHWRSAGYTLPEVMTTSTILVLLFGGLLSIHLLALRLDKLGRAKLAATDDARRSLSLLEREVRSAGWVQVGMGDDVSFNPVPPGQPQIGNALQIYPDKSQTNRFVRYYLDAETQRLLRLSSDDSGVRPVASFVTNTMVFTAEDFAGNVQTNTFNNRVIGLTLEFSQLIFPTMPVGPGAFYDFYQVRTRITRRSLE